MPNEAPKLWPEWVAHHEKFTRMAVICSGLSGLGGLLKTGDLGLRSPDSLQPRLSHGGPSALKQPEATARQGGVWMATPQCDGPG
jgi:hypothetical protein